MRKILGFFGLVWTSLFSPWCVLAFWFRNSIGYTGRVNGWVLVVGVATGPILAPVSRRLLFSSDVGLAKCIAAYLVLPAISSFVVLAVDVASGRTPGTTVTAKLWANTYCLPSDGPDLTEPEAHWFDQAHKTLWTPRVVCWNKLHPSTPSVNLVFVSSDTARFTLPDGSTGTFHRESRVRRILRILRIDVYKRPFTNA